MLNTLVIDVRGLLKLKVGCWDFVSPNTTAAADKKEEKNCAKNT